MHEVVAAVLKALQPVLAEPHGAICVALSGGLDSAVLLHVLARSGVAPLRAVYINHQLHPDAAAWGRHCERLCAALGVAFMTRTVTVETGTGDGPEAAARRARYDALTGCLAAGDILVTGHHQDDQNETVLLNLMRGAGATGLAGIPRSGHAGATRLLRPLLDLPRAALHAYARTEGLEWIEDPSNTDQRMDRNFLRHEVLPVLESRWPGIRATIGRSARLASEAAALLDELGAQDARRVQRRGKVLLAALVALSDPRRRNVIRYLCRRELGSVPSEAGLREGLAQLMSAGGDRRPLLSWAGGEIRRYRTTLYLLPPLGRHPDPDQLIDLPAHPGARVALDPGCGQLRLVRAHGQGLAVAKIGRSLSVRFRAGGERIRPAGERHTRELKKLLQERGVVPWMRDRIPLAYSGSALAAVAGLWVATEFAAQGGEPGLRIRWDRHPVIE